jgi:cell division protein FtsL
MVLAETKLDYQRSYAPAPEAALPRRTVVTPPAVKQRVRTSPRARYMVKWAVCVLIALTLASRFAYAATLSANIRGLEQQLAQATAENGQLKVQAAELQSLARIEQVATTKLGMVKPESSRAVAAPQTTSTTVASLTSQDQTQHTAAGGWFTSLQRWWTQLINTGRAQAKGL